MVCAYLVIGVVTDLGENQAKQLNIKAAYKLVIYSCTDISPNVS